MAFTFILSAFITYIGHRMVLLFGHYEQHRKVIAAMIVNSAGLLTCVGIALYAAWKYLP